MRIFLRNVSLAVIIYAVWLFISAENAGEWWSAYQLQTPSQDVRIESLSWVKAIAVAIICYAISTIIYRFAKNQK